ncbi:hypothetical protein MMC25_006047 [Agyrium rufum]|nr:hypothetical protein [Agyrium rufum]
MTDRKEIRREQFSTWLASLPEQVEGMSIATEQVDQHAVDVENTMDDDIATNTPLSERPKRNRSLKRVKNAVTGLVRRVSGRRRNTREDSIADNTAEIDPHGISIPGRTNRASLEFGLRDPLEAVDEQDVFATISSGSRTVASSSKYSGIPIPTKPPREWSRTLMIDSKVSQGLKFAPHLIGRPETARELVIDVKHRYQSMSRIGGVPTDKTLRLRTVYNNTFRSIVEETVRLP